MSRVRRFRPSLRCLENRLIPANIVVNNDFDGGPGSLRDALNIANANGAADTITFNLGTLPATIAPGVLGLPGISEPDLLIDGWSHAGFTGKPMVELGGIGSASSGLIVAASNVTIRGLVINGFRNGGLLVTGPVGNVRLHGNYIGTDITGMTALPNLGAGILIADFFGSPANIFIGGTGANERNLISGNVSDGIDIRAGAAAVSIVGNYIGVQVNGTGKLGNGQNGVKLDDNVSGVIIGGPTLFTGNVLANNGQAGVYLTGKLNDFNTIQNNYIGTDTTTLTDLGNGNRGVWLTLGANENLIKGNVIGGNSSDGVLVDILATANTIVGNQIGFNDGAGVALVNAPGNIVGGPSLADRNYIAGNRDGVHVVENPFGNSAGCVVQNNVIGVDATGKLKLGHAEQGIEIGGSPTVQVLGNLIVGSKGAGIEIRDNSDFAKVQGNTVGLDASGAIYANGFGIVVRNESEGALIGGPNAADRNVISGNADTAVAIRDVNVPNYQVVQWTAGDGGNGHYYVLTQSAPWANAASAAKASGGYLASIADASENNFLHQNFSRANGSVWIGYTDDPAFGGTENGNTSGTSNAGKGWVWHDGATTGDTAGFNKWFGSEPSNSGLAENFAELRDDGFWNDAGNVARRTIVEFDSLPVLANLFKAFNLVTTVQNNYIGTNAAGTAAVGNVGDGVLVQRYLGGPAGGVNILDNVVASNRNGVRANAIGGRLEVFQWTTGAGANNHYYVVGPETTFRAADAAAKSAGGHLASIGDANEQAFVQANVLTTLSSASVWIGYTDDPAFGGTEFGDTNAKTNKGQGFVWTDGTPVGFSGGMVTSYQNWSLGEPNDAGGEDYAEMNLFGDWNDVPSISRRPLYEFVTPPNLASVAAALGISANVTVQGNKIGTDVTGTVNLRNSGSGVLIAEALGAVVGSNLDGANDAAEANIIRFNKAAGVSILPVDFPTVRFITGVDANNHYYVFAPARNFLASRSNAVSAGGDLASMGCAEENDFVAANLRIQADNDTWIGYTDDESFGGTEFGDTNGKSTKGQGFVWTDGTPVSFNAGSKVVTSFQSWAIGEPNDAGGEDYASMTINGRWNDLGLLASRPAILEFLGPPNYAALAAAYNAAPTMNVSVRGNRISDNVGLGIDLGGGGVTANDAGDVDIGANNLINFPVVTAITTGPSTKVSGTYNGSANSTLNLDFYASATGSQGDRYLGSTPVVTDPSGNATFANVVLTGATAFGDVITATATDAVGNSSEFSVGLFTAGATSARVVNVVIDDGTVQRSVIRSLTATFDQRVDQTLDVTAFSLTKQGGGSVTLNASIDNTGSATVVTLTFVGGEVEFNSLKNGRYNFAIDATKATTGGGTKQLDGNGDGTGGDNYGLNSATAPSAPTNIWRLAGDSDGDNDVDATDFGRFRPFFGLGASIFDFDNDCDTDTSDFGVFRANFGGAV